ncbi:phage portal protein [Duganella sp. FT27W]|nr:phage portal protein [Duganella sp. FT27W]
MKTFTPGATATIDPTSVDGTIVPLDGDQKKLKALISRRHPQYEENLKHWEFLAATYKGGRDWFTEENVFRYVKEGEQEYKDRVDRAYRFNHSHEVVDLLNKYLFKQNITRNDADAPASVKEFWKLSTKAGLKINDFARQVGRKASILGRLAIVVDNKAKRPTTEIISQADAKTAGLRTYAYAVGPAQLLDYSYDEDGGLNWVLIQEVVRDDVDPMESSGKEMPRYRIWTKNEWRLFEERQVGRTNKTRVVEVGQGIHGLGEVPVIIHDHFITDDEYTSPGLIDDVAYLDRAVANYLSNLDAIIQDQTFSQLAMPAQNVLPGTDNYNAMLDMGTKRIFLYDGEGGARPEFISPDPKQAQMILAVIDKIINEIYHTVGLAGERTKQDNSMGIDNSSGVAKAYDFERVNALLQAKADSLELFENRLARLVAKWNGEALTDNIVSYPDNFDTRGLYDEFDLAARLMLIDAPKGIRQEQMKSVIDKLFPQLAKDLKAKMMSELKEWPTDPVQLAAAMTAATAANSPTSVSAKATAKEGAEAPPAKSPAGQGSVKKDTK